VEDEFAGQAADDEVSVRWPGGTKLLTVVAVSYGNLVPEVLFTRRGLSHTNVLELATLRGPGPRRTVAALMQRSTVRVLADHVYPGTACSISSGKLESISSVADAAVRIRTWPRSSLTTRPTDLQAWWPLLYGANFRAPDGTAASHTNTRSSWDGEQHAKSSTRR